MSTKGKTEVTTVIFRLHAHLILREVLIQRELTVTMTSLLPGLRKDIRVNRILCGQQCRAMATAISLLLVHHISDMRHIPVTIVIIVLIANQTDEILKERVQNVSGK